MSSTTATTSTLAGLGLSFDSASASASAASSSFSSSEESFDSLFSNVSLASPHESPADVDAEEPTVPTRGHWHITYGSDWDSSEPEDGVNHFDTYLGLPEVSDLMPWPTSPDQAHLASPPAQSDAQSVPVTPNDRGYETDTDSPRAQRRQRRRDAHKPSRRRQRVQYLVEHVEPIIEELPSLEEILARIAAHASPEPEDETEAVDITDYVYYASDADSDELHRRDSDEYDSDSDEDRYYGESYDEGEDLDASGSGGGVHYLVTHVRPIIEDLPLLDDLQARVDEGTAEESEEDMRAVAQATIGLGLGLPVDESPRIIEGQETHSEVDLLHPPVPFHIEPALPPVPDPPAHHYDGFETIDLTDDTSFSPARQHEAQHPQPQPHTTPDSPDLRPHPAAETPSPIALASPIPVAAFRQFDDVLHHNPWADSESDTGAGAGLAYAARHPFATGWDE
ncbi:hypothetical protein BV20DRAFT_1038391 [Pilatotrama ljubarskyi]|nr:hypothetical protein BV20DRAFT_1038391 [Pilatotrama ljubarskyi]